MSDEICLFSAFVDDDSISLEDVLNQEYAKGYQQGKEDTLSEYNGYRRKVIDITTTEDVRKLKRVATVDISENLIKELSQEDLVRVIIDEIAEQMQKGKENE